MRQIGLKEIMGYYKPVWVVFISVIVSIIAAFSFPVYGLIFTRFLFVLL